MFSLLTDILKFYVDVSLCLKKQMKRGTDEPDPLASTNGILCNCKSKGQKVSYVAVWGDTQVTLLSGYCNIYNIVYRIIPFGKKRWEIRVNIRRNKTSQVITFHIFVF